MRNVVWASIQHVKPHPLSYAMSSATLVCYLLLLPRPMSHLSHGLTITVPDLHFRHRWWTNRCQCNRRRDFVDSMVAEYGHRPHRSSVRTPLCDAPTASVRGTNCHIHCNCTTDIEENAKSETQNKIESSRLAIGTRMTCLNASVATWSAHKWMVHEQTEQYMQHTEEKKQPKESKKYGLDDLARRETSIRLMESNRLSVLFFGADHLMAWWYGLSAWPATPFPRNIYWFQTVVGAELNSQVRYFSLSEATSVFCVYASGRPVLCCLPATPHSRIVSVRLSRHW